jgi:hypothetical protein
MSGAFELALRQFAEKAGNRADEVVRKVAIDVMARVVDRSPVGNPTLWKSPPPAGYVGGRFRANWTLQVGSIDYTTTQATDAGGEATKGRLAAALPDKVAGTIIYIANSLPYAWKLETGHSTQSPPNGMVGLTVQEFLGIVDKAARS